MVQNLPTIAEGHAQLVRLVEQTVAELTERIELVGLREQRDQYLETQIAQTDVTHDGELRERYDAMAGREHHAALREVRALQGERRKYGAGEGEEASEQEPPADAKEPAQNEPTVPEVGENVEEVEGSVDVTLSPRERVPEGRVRAAAPPSAEAALSPAEDEAIRAAYQARLQRVLERIEQDEANASAALDPADRDRPPPELETSG
jgi:hypothetical protein